MLTRPVHGLVARCVTQEAVAPLVPEAAADAEETELWQSSGVDWGALVQVIQHFVRRGEQQFNACSEIQNFILIHEFKLDNGVLKLEINPMGPSFPQSPWVFSVPIQKVLTIFRG